MIDVSVAAGEMLKDLSGNPSKDALQRMTRIMVNGRILAEAWADAQTKGAMKYVYGFSVWPAEHGFCRQMYQLFEFLQDRIEMEFTEEEFSTFREAINQHGLTFREISRVPFHEQETIL